MRRGGNLAHDGIPPNHDRTPNHDPPALLRRLESALQPRDQRHPRRHLGHGVQHAGLLHVGHVDELLRHPALERWRRDHGLQDLQGRVYLWVAWAVSD